MKNLLLGSAALTLFAITIIIFQISCQKDASAQSGSNYTLPSATLNSLGGVMVDGTTIKVDATGKISLFSSSLSAASLVVYSKTNASGIDEIWKANIDGTSQQKVNIVMPGSYVVRVNGDGGQIRITSDKQKLVFKGVITSTNTYSLFSCAIDGSNVIKLIDNIGTSFDAD